MAAPVSTFLEFMTLPPELRLMFYEQAVYPGGRMHPDRSFIVVRLTNSHFSTDRRQIIDCSNLHLHGCNPSLAFDGDLSNCPNTQISRAMDARRVYLRRPYIANEPVLDVIHASRTLYHEARFLVEHRLRSNRYFFNSTDAAFRFVSSNFNVRSRIHEVDITGYGGSNSDAFQLLAVCPNLRSLTLRCKFVQANATTGLGVEAQLMALLHLQEVNFAPLLEFDRYGKFIGYSSDPHVTDSHPVAQQIIAALTQPGLPNPPHTLYTQPPATTAHPWSPRWIMYL